MKGGGISMRSSCAMTRQAGGCVDNFIPFVANFRQEKGAGPESAERGTGARKVGGRAGKLRNGEGTGKLERMKGKRA